MSDEPKRSSKYYNETAEVELVSSDNVAFKVPAFPLRYSSEVFRAMIGIGSNFKDRQPPVQLSDPEIESSKILENVLDIQCQLKDICDIDLFESVLVIKFLLKYEFKRELELVRLQLRSRLLDDTDAVWVFLRACHSGHFDVCAKAVRIAPLQRWQGDHVTDGKFGGAAEDVWTLDPTGMPQKYFDLMPADCRWALFRSCREAMTAQNPSSAQRSRMARAFTRLMSLRDPEKPGVDSA